MYIDTLREVRLGVKSRAVKVPGGYSTITAYYYLLLLTDTYHHLLLLTTTEQAGIHV